MVAAGYGRGTGTGAAVIKAAEGVILAVGVVTKPFDFKGSAEWNRQMKAFNRFRPMLIH